MLAGSRRWLRLTNLNIRMVVFVFTRACFAFQSPLIAFKCFIAQTPNAEESSEFSVAKMLWCAWEAGQQIPPLFVLAKGLQPAAGRHAGAGDPGYRPARKDRRRFPAPRLRQPFAKKEPQLPSTCAANSLLFPPSLSRFITPFCSALAANNPG